MHTLIGVPGLVSPRQPELWAPIRRFDLSLSRVPGDRWCSPTSRTVTLGSRDSKHLVGASPHSGYDAFHRAPEDCGC